MSHTVRVSDAILFVLKQLARQEGTTMQAILEHAVENYRRQRFLEEVNASYEKLRKNPQEWESLQQEYRSLEGTLADGLNDNDREEG